MKTSIALIVAETRRTVGRLARGAAAQARRVLASGGDLRSVTQTSATIYRGAPRGEKLARLRVGLNSSDATRFLRKLPCRGGRAHGEVDAARPASTPQHPDDVASRSVRIRHQTSPAPAGR